MKKTLVIALAAAALIASTAAARTVQDRNWHMCFSMSGSEKLTNLDQLTPAETPAEAAEVSAAVGVNLTGSLAKAISPTFAIGIRGGFFAEGDGGYEGASGGTGTEVLGILEGRCTLNSWLGLKGTAGVGRVSISKDIAKMNVDPDNMLGVDFHIGKISESGLEVLLEPGLEVRLSSVVTLEVLGAYRIRPSKEVEAANLGYDKKITVLDSGFSMGGGIGFHF
ncbi:MAG TPA: hypothetical protein PLR32_02395 [candidate division Zixibacteria bacterium]|nr:hypothetical protein [candidate division Zixibacteria bacterium]MDD4916724.1 hypothetical protein [candidate division Zixibacteria bacterium]MDM7972105.1 hypothetical protein [candidate division Zixibacteria bacterium]HOD66945.1 hypothetical protein [candidate division Zixibacteria bacterium]HOZ07388.1 hypothetical protein [candidate division Zixibacteria bacterium]